jgi:hypothetical protein
VGLVVIDAPLPHDPRADGAQSSAILASVWTSVKRHDSAPATASARSGQGGIWVPGQEQVRRAVVDEGGIGQPLHGPAPGPGMPERAPRGQQVGVLLVELVLEAAGGALALDRKGQRAVGAFIGYPIGEVGHVLVPDP